MTNPLAFVNDADLASYMRRFDPLARVPQGSFFGTPAAASNLSLPGGGHATREQLEAEIARRKPFRAAGLSDADYEKAIRGDYGGGAPLSGIFPGTGMPGMPGVIPTGPSGSPDASAAPPTAAPATPAAPALSSAALAAPPPSNGWDPAPSSSSGNGMDRVDRILRSIRGPESGNNPNAVNGAGSTAKGLYQMIDGTWNQFLKSGGHSYTAADRMNPEAQTAAAKWYVGQIDNELQGALGRQANDTEVRLAWALGPKGAKAFLTADPNADAMQTYRAAGGSDAAFSQNGNIMKPGMTVGQVMNGWRNHFANQPVGPGVAGGTNVPTPQSGEMPTGEKAPPATIPDPTSPSAISQQEPGNDGMFSSMNLLRMAAAAAGGKNLNESLSGMFGAIPKGMQEDELLKLKRQQVQSGAVGEAAKLMELGINPAVAMDMASGRMPRAQMEEALKGFTPQGKVQNAGIFYDSTGRAQIATFNPRTGQTEFKPAPEGMVRAEDGLMRHLSKGDAEAYQAALTKANGSQDRLGKMQAALDIVNSGKVTSGPNFMDQFRTHLANRFGLGANDPTSQQLLSNIFADLNVSAMDKFKGLGPMSDADRAALERAGAGWHLDNNALRVVLSHYIRNQQHENSILDAWQGASPEDRRQGFQSFSYNWRKNNPLKPMDVLGGGSGSAPPPLTSFNR